MKRRLFIPILLLTLLVGSPAFSADFQKGLDAANRGDFATALKEWTLLAEQGNASAQSNLGLMYRKGRGVTQDYKTAVKWYKLAVQQGEIHAQQSLGFMYGNGLGVPQDYVKAHMWFDIAASHGDKNARENRDIVKNKLSPTQLETAERLALGCILNNYKGC